MAARFFVDENDLALGRALADLHGDVVFPGHPDLPEVPRQSLDDEWLEVIGAQGLVVITRGAAGRSATRGVPLSRQAIRIPSDQSKATVTLVVTKEAELVELRPVKVFVESDDRVVTSSSEFKLTVRK